MFRQLGFGMAGGLIAGSLVGLCEAIYILSSASTGEYGALLYAVVLYGILGLCGGAGIGVGLAVLALIGRGSFRQPPYMQNLGAITAGSNGAIDRRIFAAKGLVAKTPTNPGAPRCLGLFPGDGRR